jgi:replicative DNA helicase
VDDFVPINREAEAAALGCALVADEAAQVLATMPAHLFAVRKHRAVHDAIKSLLSEQDIVSLAMLRTILSKSGNWSDDDNGNGHAVTMDYLADLTDNAPPPAQIVAYGRLLRDAYLQRRIMETSRKIAEQASTRFLDSDELAELQESFQQTAFDLGVSTGGKKRLTHVKDILGGVLDTIQARRDGSLTQFGISTGFRKLDENTGGFRPGELIIVAARPGMGKTSFALDAALNAVAQGPVAFFSVEMGAEQIGQRLLSKKAAVNLRFLRSGQIEEYQIESVVNALGTLSDHALYVDDDPAVTPAQIRFRVRELSVKTKAAVGLVIVDYLQIMSSGRKFDSREREVSHLSREMKRLTKDLDCPIVLLSQLNRELERRQDKRPTLADLRESGAIEQDADLVVGLFQPFPYTNNDEDRGKAEAIILKQRNGPIGTIDLMWSPETATYHGVI